MQRYERQTALPDFGITGQEKLSSAHALLVGVGGLGSLIATYLTAAGIGKLSLIDGDMVSLSNLHRQVLYTEKQIGSAKTLCAAENLSKLNHHTHFTVYQEHLTSTNAIAIAGNCDLIIDGSDNAATRYLMNDVAIGLNIPLFYGSISLFEGQVAVFNQTPHSATYRCLYPDEENMIKNIPNKAIINTAPAFAATLQCNEVLKYITHCGKTLHNQLFLFHLNPLKTQNLNIIPNPKQRQIALENYRKLLHNKQKKQHN